MVPTTNPMPDMTETTIANLIRLALNGAFSSIPENIIRIHDMNTPNYT